MAEIRRIRRRVDEHILPDRERARRLGFDEAILCDSKTEDQLRAILGDADERGTTLLLTRLDPATAARLAGEYPNELGYEPLSRTAYFGRIAEPRGAPRIVVVSAGTSDVAVCREAVRTLHYHGFACAEVYDVGVAGLWRLLERVEEIREFPVAIAVAGMDAALPSVLAGLVPALVVAVPTSAGYGVAEGGRAALDAALSSCAPGLVVVNIDNGYGAACAAMRALRALDGTG